VILSATAPHLVPSAISVRQNGAVPATANGLQLTRAFVQIPDIAVRRSIVKLVEQIAAPENDTD
jgi:hypothetical protein